MNNYEQYKKYYMNYIINLPGDQRTEKFFYYMLKVNPNMTLQEFSDLEDKIILDED